MSRVTILLLALVVAAGSSKPGQKPASSEEAKEVRAACERGDLDACEDLAARLTFGKGVPVDERAAAELLQKTCDRGSGSACASLAVAYWEGQGVNASDEKARALVEQAVRQGGAKALGELGNLYGAGRGLRRNDERASLLLTPACAADDAASCFDLAQLSLTKDADRQPLLEKACKLGSRPACARLTELGQGR